MLSLVGAFIALYLTLYKVGVVGNLTCTVGSCETVNTSRWATLLGFPIAAWGLATYILLLLLAVVPGIAAAGKRSHDDNWSRGNTWQAAPQGEAGGRCPGMSLDQAIASAERKHKARVVKASTEQGGNGCVYVLRLLSDEGRVWTVRIDSRSGG